MNAPDAQGNDRAGSREPGCPLTRAMSHSRDAAAIGFDWPDVQGVRDKLDEELAELDDAVQRRLTTDMHEELGDLLFTIANLARHLGLDPARALDDATHKFDLRFAWVLASLAKQGIAAQSCSPEELDQRWRDAKRALS